MDNNMELVEVNFVNSFKNKVALFVQKFQYADLHTIITELDKIFPGKWKKTYNNGVYKFSIDNKIKFSYDGEYGLFYFAELNNA